MSIAGVSREDRQDKAWQSATKDKPVTAGDLIDLAIDKQYDGARTFPALYNRKRGRIIDGYKLNGPTDSHSKQTQWRLLQV